jgi:hypothetical protein
MERWGFALAVLGVLVAAGTVIAVWWIILSASGN